MNQIQLNNHTEQVESLILICRQYRHYKKRVSKLQCVKIAYKNHFFLSTKIYKSLLQNITGCNFYLLIQGKTNTKSTPEAVASFAYSFFTICFKLSLAHVLHKTCSLNAEKNTSKTSDSIKKKKWHHKMTSLM